jgi:hypothetical protein
MPHILVFGLAIWALLSVGLGVLLGAMIRHNAGASARVELARGQDRDERVPRLHDLPTAHWV